MSDAWQLFCARAILFGTLDQAFPETECTQDARITYFSKERKLTYMTSHTYTKIYP